MSNISLATAQKEGYVIGLKAESGVYHRREIDDFMVNDPDGFNLFILALERIMKDEGGKQDKMNYFQIAGIHGLPTVNWDGVVDPNAGGPGSYCTHASYLFPSWHRPYLVMMEQTIYSNMKDIAGEFKNPKYLDAVKRFRLPFWDWIKPRERRATNFPGVGRNGNRTVSYPYNYDLPIVLQIPQLVVYRSPKDGHSEDELVPIPNPLLSYTFPKVGSVASKSWGVLDRSDDSINEGRRANNQPQRLYASRNHTVRVPTRDSETSNYERLNLGLNMIRESSVEQALDLVSAKYQNYLDFAAEAPRWQYDDQGRPIRGTLQGPAGSLEDIHNTYHGRTGGDGHMGRVPVAAFDPVFWLHHCNIDRILTVWQAIHTGPNTYLPPGDTEYGADVPLWPFRKDGKNSFWTSTLAKDARMFGYTYDDIEGLQPQQIATRWDQSYRWSLQSNALSKPTDWMKPIPAQSAQAFQFDKAQPSLLPSTVTNTLATVLPQSVLPQKVVAASKVAKEETPLDADEEAESATASVVIPDEKVPEVQKLVQAETTAVVPVVQWYLDTQVERDALDGAFTIYYFIGSPEAMAALDATPDDYAVAPINAGTTHVFTAPRDACDNCNKNADRGVIVTGTTPITPILRDYLHNADLLTGLAPDQVVPFLQKHLHWRVKAINNIVVPEEDVRGLKVNVSATMAAQDPDTGAPAAWRAFDYPEVVAGRTSGDPV